MAETRIGATVDQNRVHIFTTEEGGDCVFVGDVSVTKKDGRYTVNVVLWLPVERIVSDSINKTLEIVTSKV